MRALRELKSPQEKEDSAYSLERELDYDSAFQEVASSPGADEIGENGSKRLL